MPKKINKLNAGRCPTCGRYMTARDTNIKIRYVNRPVRVWVCKNYKTCNRWFKPK